MGMNCITYLFSLLLLLTDPAVSHQLSNEQFELKVPPSLKVGRALPIILKLRNCCNPTDTNNEHLSKTNKVCIGLHHNDDGTPFEINVEVDALWCSEGQLQCDTIKNEIELPELELEALSVGNYAVWAVATSVTDQHQTRTKRVKCYPDIFEPTYDWQSIESGQSIPSGLEVRLSLNSEGKQAKIPNSFRLQIWIDEISSFFRMDVKRNTLISEIVANAKDVIFKKIPFSTTGSSVTTANSPCISLVTKKEEEVVSSTDEKVIERHDYDTASAALIKKRSKYLKKKKNYVRREDIEEYVLKEDMSVEESRLFHHIDGLHFHLNEACIVGMTDEEYNLL